MPGRDKGHEANWSVEGLRTRFKPRSRVSGLFLQVVPWIDIVLVAALAYFACNRTTIQHGKTFELPKATTREGLLENAIPVIMLLTADGGDTLVFVGDDRLELDDAGFPFKLKERIRDRMHLTNVHDMLLMADRRIPHGDVIRLVNLARESGISRVSVSVKPE